jgi:beta-phosphoglucomutase-like phosphatase (HAD superfamily)
VHAYLETHDLLAQFTVVASSIAEAASTLEASPAESLLIASSPADIEAAQAAGAPSIGCARTPDDATHLLGAGATVFV